MLGLRSYFNQPHEQSWPTGGTLDWLWPASEQAGIPIALAAASFLPVVGQIAERHPGLKLIVDHMGVPRATKGDASYKNLPQLLALARHKNVAVKATGQAGYAEDAYSFRSNSPTPAAGLRRLRAATHVLGNRHHPHGLLLEAMRHLVHRRPTLAGGA